MFDKSSTSDLRPGRFILSQVLTTAGMPIAMDDFISHHFTALPEERSLIALPAEFIEIKLQETESAPPKGGLLAAVGAWEDFEDIDGFINEIYKTREKAVDREVDL